MRSTSVGYHTAKIGFLPVIAGSILLVSSNAANALVPARGVDSLSDEVRTLDRPLFDEPQPNQLEQWDRDFVLLIQVLCIILQCEPNTQAGEPVALLTAQGVIDRYRTQGLMPRLSQSEIQQGIEAVTKCQHHLRMGLGTPGTLSLGLAGDLDQAYTDMLSDLHRMQDAVPTSGR